MAKILVESLEKITIKQFKDGGYFDDGRALNLMGFYFTSSKCNLGGKRFLFQCICGNRAYILFVSDSNYRCRKCLNLAYQSQNIKKNLRNDQMLRACDALIKAQELTRTLKRYTYAGKPTKKAKKLSLLYSRFFYLT